MRKMIIVLLFAFILFPQKSQMSKEIEKMKFPEIEWKVPEVGKEIERIILKSNAILFIKEEHKLPIVNISIFLRNSGYANLEYGEYLTSKLFLEMLIKGGTQKYTPEQIVEILESNAIDLYASEENDFYRIDYSFLPEFTDIALELLEEILFKPRFDENVLKLEKERVLDDFRRTLENPSSVLFYLKNYVLFPEHPASGYADIEGFKNLKKERLFDIHRIFFTPDNMIITAIGDFKNSEIKGKIENVFSDKYNNLGNISYKKEFKIEYGGIGLTMEVPVKKELKPMKKNKVFLYNLKIPQGYILILHEGIRGFREDYFDLMIMHDILGSGGFTSRIVSKVRNEKGLAYSTWGYYDVIGKYKGNFEAFCATKIESIYDAIFYILDEMKRIKREKVSEKELKVAKESLINSTISRLGNPYNFITRVAHLELTERPLDFYTNYVENVKKVSIDGVFSAANKYLKPEEVSIIIVGNLERIDTLKLKEFGEIEILNLNK